MVEQLLQHRFFRSKWLVTGWFVLINFLFYLPGSAIPKNNWLTRIYIDKWVHITIFAILVFLWRTAYDRKEKYYNVLLLFLALIYGILVEIIQYYWVPNRDFDLYDVIADLAGSFLGLFVWLRYIKK